LDNRAYLWSHLRGTSPQHTAIIQRGSTYIDNPWGMSEYRHMIHAVTPPAPLALEYGEVKQPYPGATRN
jgi:hypothetical protein